MVQGVLLVLVLTAGCGCILPELGDSGISHILEDNGHRGLERVLLEEEGLPEELQEKPEDAIHQESKESFSPSPQPHDLLPSHHNETEWNEVADGGSIHAPRELETNTLAGQSSDLGNDIHRGCVSEEDCGTGMYCLYDVHNSRCRRCKATDVPCAKDEECCGDQLCVWGQCSPNATKGDAGSTCRYQTDCGPDLCCAFHKALVSAVCSVKPIERERCVGASNHLVELLSWDIQDEGPRKHCPCAGNLRCQYLGRGSMCLRGEDTSEEDLTDTLYSEIDYIV